MFLIIFPIWRPSECRRTCSDAPPGFSVSLVASSAFLWPLSENQFYARDHPGTPEGRALAQTVSQKLKREALGEGPPPCSSINLKSFQRFEHIFKRSPGRSRDLRDASYGSPRSLGSSPGGFWGCLWEPRGSSEQSSGVLRMTLEWS